MRGLELHRPQAVVVDPENNQESYGVFTAQPFERGWGVTIGNALRRILLSSIEGCAITAVRLAGVDHEYDSIPGVMEDVTDLILNLKRVPMLLEGLGTTTAMIRKSGPGELRASDLQCGPELTIADPSLYLATLDEEGAVEAELVVCRGRGWVPADEHDQKELGVGFIFLDSAFSPVRKANYRIEPARVGQATDYEKLVLEVWTNGTVAPATAVAEAARLLAEHLPIFAGLEATAQPTPAAREASELEASLDVLELSAAICNKLRNAGIERLRDLVSRPEEELSNVPGLGKKSLADVKERLEARGLSLGMRFDLPRT